MVVLEIHSKCLQTRYKSHLFSKATVFTILKLVISIVVPFIFAYNSRGFWIKYDKFYEQPTVKFKGEYLFNAVTDNISSPIICSNLPFAKDLTNFDKCLLIKAREIDNNYDKKTDELRFILSVNIENIKIYAYSLILTLEYNLNTICPLQMQSAVIIQNSLSDIPIFATNVDGYLGLNQLSPLYCPQNYRNLHFNYSVTYISSTHNSYDAKKVIQSYSRRNISTQIKNKYTTFNIGQSSKFSLHLRIRYPEHKIVYIPGFWQIIKWAWIQYFAMYVIIAWIVQKITNYVFENRLLLYYELSPLKKR